MTAKHEAEAYRPDVDGLRAVAVLSVIFFHLHKPLLPGGFLGVDIFFVISGYLISRNIMQGIADGRFSIAEFYRRRIKRIAPVMLVVVALTMLASQFLLLPEDSRNTAKSAVYSLASLANVYFWKFQDFDYFAIDSSQVPLLHLWSLGVEEQFYLLWPPLLALAYRPGRGKRLCIAALIVAAASFLLAELLYDRHQSFVYYMLPTRAGELLFGAIVAIAVLHRVEDRIASAKVPLLATVGALLLTASLFLITENQRFPGWRAVPPTAGTALLILAGHCRTNLWSRLLASRPMVWVGLISYSAYLWHWPLLALYRYGYGDPGVVACGVVLVLTLVLAWLSYRFVEQPARRATESLSRVFVHQYALPAGGLLALALVAIYARPLGVSLHSASYLQQLTALQSQTRPAYDFAWVCQSQRITQQELQNPQCVLGGGSSYAPQAILWGDSHAAHYVGMIEAFAVNAGFRFRNVEVGSCPPLLSDATRFVQARRAGDCRASLELLGPKILESPVVIVSSAWLNYPNESSGYLDAFFVTARQLARSGKLVIVIGEAPWMPGYDRRCQEKALSYPLLTCPHFAIPMSANVANGNAKLRRFAEETPNISYFDATPYLCPDGVCTAFATNGEPRYYDEKHLSMPASMELGREIVSQEGVPAVFRMVAGWR